MVLLGLWGIRRLRPKGILARTPGFVMGLVGSTAIMVLAVQLPLCEYFSEKFKSIIGVNSFSKISGICAFGGLLITFLFLALYKESTAALTCRPQNSPPLKVLPLVAVFSGKADPPSSLESEEPFVISVGSAFVKLYKYCTMTPFLALQISRALIIVWILKYYTYWCLPLLCWLYYSISYKDRRRFYWWTKIVVIPIIGLQYVSCKVFNIPSLINIKWSHIRLMERFGAFVFSLDSSVSYEIEYFWMIVTFFMCCLTIELTTSITQYKSAYSTGNSVKKHYGDLEIILNFLLKHADKLFIVMVYIIGFNKLNIMHALLLGWMIITMQFPRFTARNFTYFVGVLLLRDAGRYIALLVSLSGVTFNEDARSMLVILGFDNEFDQEKVFYKTFVDWEIPTMIYVCYIQLQIYRYLAKEQVHDLSGSKHGKFISFIKTIYGHLKKFLIWIVYLTIVLLLSYHDITAVFSIYSIMLMVIIVVHMRSDIADSSYTGPVKTLELWKLMNVYNGIALLASYFFCFSIYTMETEVALSDYAKAIFKLVGFDFVHPTGSGFLMQKKFLPQFLILYLGFFATSHIKDELSQQHNNNLSFSYSYKICNLGLRLLDLISLYSFHILFLVFTMLALLWKLSGSMWLILALFSIHYCSLHLAYMRSRPVVPHTLNYLESERISMEVREMQKAQSVVQRKSTLNLLILLLAVLITLSVLARFTDYTEKLVDIYWTGKERLSGLYLVKVVQAVAMYTGIFRKEIKPVNTFSYGILGYIVMLGLCVLEVRSTDWLCNRMGYTFNYAKNTIEKDGKEIDIEEANKENAIKAKHRQRTMMICKCIFEHLIVLTICMSAIVKNNVSELCFLPIALYCLFFGTTLKSSLVFSYYSWIALAIHYLSEVIAMKQESVPQYIDDSIIMQVFNLSPAQWPLYKLILGDSVDNYNWACYLLVEHFKVDVVGLMVDTLVVWVQIIYFQHFCNPVYSLHNFQSGDAMKKLDASVYPSNSKSNLLRKVHYFMKGIFFVYSHIFSLFILLVLGICSGGITSLMYVVFCVIFMQYDLFSSMGIRTWALPKYIRFILKPYMFCDIAFQFIFQIPCFLSYRDSAFMRFAGVQRIEEYPMLVVLKAIMLSVVLYQDRIFASEQYVQCCQKERMQIQNARKTRQTCMTYLYNNKRVHNFAHDVYKEKAHQESMEQITNTIEQWNQILLRKDRITGNEPGLQLKVLEIKRKIQELKQKLDMGKMLPESESKDKGILVTIYLWLYHRVNFILLKPIKELIGLETKLAEGLNYFPGKLIKLYQKQYKAKIIIKMLKAEVKLLHIADQKLEERKEDLSKKSSEIEEKKLKYTKISEEIEAITAFKSIFPQILYLLLQYCYSSVHIICYLFMIMAQCTYGNLLSLVYVGFLFGYVLVVRCRPHRWYWKFLLLYSGLVIVLKLACGMIYELFTKHLCNTGEDCQYTQMFDDLQINVFLGEDSGIRLGLFEAHKLGSYVCVMYDIFIMFTTLLHIYMLTKLGIYDKREEDRESIIAAINRINNYRQSVLEPPPLVEEEKSQAVSAEGATSEIPKEPEGSKEDAEKTNKGSTCFKRVFFESSAGQNLFPLLRVFSSYLTPFDRMRNLGKIIIKLQ